MTTVDGAVLSEGIGRLQPLTLVDADEWLAGEDEDQIRWFEFPRPAVRADVVRAIEGWMESWRTGGPVRQWGVRDISFDQLVGGVELRDLGGGEINLTYVIFPGFRGRGAATRAARLALSYAATEMGIATGRIRILEGNTASMAVARRLGAVESGTETSGDSGTLVVSQLGRLSPTAG